MPALRRYKESSSGHFLRASCPVRHARATCPRSSSELAFIIFPTSPMRHMPPTAPTSSKAPVDAGARARPSSHPVTQFHVHACGHTLRCRSAPLASLLTSVSLAPCRA